MTKEQMLEIIKLLSALESWSFSAGQRMPDYLFERLDKSINELTEEVLKTPRDSRKRLKIGTSGNGLGSLKRTRGVVIFQKA